MVGLRCVVCGKTYQSGEIEYTCPQHPDSGNLDVLYDYALIKEHVRQHGFTDQRGMWRYRALMPLHLSALTPPLEVGDTPLYTSDVLAKRHGLRKVFVKDDGRNPTASLKDRASALIVARAMAEGRSIVTTASTGNAAAALAGIAASVQLPVVIFVPASAPEAKIAQLLAYGAHVFLVNGTYDDAFGLCVQASQKFGWYCRNTGYNPYTVEGKKTVAYEICSQLSGVDGQFRAPDAVCVSVGDGNIISGVYKGFVDLYELGWIDRIPRLIGVQAEGSAALYQAWKSNQPAIDMQPIQTSTLADSISAGLPRDRVRAIHAVQQSGGIFLTVSDDEILQAIPTLAQATGVFAEPAAAAAYAGLQRAASDALINPDDEVVLLITGNGLKDIASARKSVGKPYQIEAELPAVKKIAATLELL